MRRIMCFVYGVACYAIFFITFLYLIAFLANFIVPKGINDGVPTATLGAVLIDLGLIALFGIQHSVMAQADFQEAPGRVAAGECGTEHLCPGSEPGPDHSLLAVAPATAGYLVHSIACLAGEPVGPPAGRLRNRAAVNLHHRSLRSVRSSSGLA